MTQLLSLGAINKLTGKYVYPKIANKKGEYVCPECNKDLILCQGEIRVHHFRHKVDNVNPCHHYNNPTETQIHKDAKQLMKTLLENKTQIQFVRQCVSCKNNIEFNLPEIKNNSIISLEHRFNYKGDLRIADVAHTLNGEIMGIYEICNTHKTCSENRPEPFVEINAYSLLTLFNTLNTNENKSLIINCIRSENCQECINNELRNLRIPKLEDFVLDKYIRFKLGQEIFPTPRPKYCKVNNNIGEECDDCENCKYMKWYDNVWKNKGHLRIDFHSGNDINNNKNIIELFSKDFINKKIVIHSWKGGCHAYIISNSNYKKYDYWKCQNSWDLELPCENIIDFGGNTTIEIITLLIKYCEKEFMIKTMEYIKCI